MTRETNDFADYRFAPRTGIDKARAAWPIEHYRPAPDSRWGQAGWTIVGLLGAFALGWLASRGVRA